MRSDLSTTKMHGENFQEDLKPKNYINLINPEGIFLSIDKCE